MDYDSTHETTDIIIDLVNRLNFQQAEITAYLDEIDKLRKLFPSAPSPADLLNMSDDDIKSFNSVSNNESKSG